MELIGEARYQGLKGADLDATLKQLDPMAAALFSTVGARLAKEGVRFLYHNHDFEFFFNRDLKMGGMDYLMKELDPDSCGLNMDVAWVFRGSDPAYFDSSRANENEEAPPSFEPTLDFMKRADGRCSVAALAKQGLFHCLRLFAVGMVSRFEVRP